MKAKIKAYVLHYLAGMFASCFNAGIKAIKINGGVTLAAAAAPQLLSTPDLKTMLGVFVAAFFWEAIDYFSDHPLPVIAPIVLPTVPVQSATATGGV